MAWPSATDFQSVMQNAQGVKNLNFKTDYLQNTYPEPGAMGLPYMDSGNFAVVFLRNDNNSAKKYGIRCPTMEPLPDQEERYTALDNQMQSIGAGQGLSFLVSFLYHKEEVFYDKVWYPTIEMEWVQGASPLNSFVEAHLNEPDILHNIAMQFKISIDVMQMYEISHGDIQHGNVLIDQNGILKYVDYDDFFIANAMRGKGMKSFGEGMAHYQHPDRKASHFETYVDLFPALVVYLSLGALAADPGLFQKYNSDENLIFKKTDFQNSGKTAIWNDLKKSSSDIVLHLTEEFQAVCRLPIDKTPSLNEVLKRIGASLPSGKKIQPAPTSIPATTPQPPLIPAAPTTLTVPAQPTTPSVPAQPPPPTFPLIVLPTTSLPFGDVRVGQSGVQKTFQIQNSGTADLNIQSASSNNLAFTVQNLPSRTVTAGGQSVIVTVEFHPTARGNFNAAVEIRSNDPASPIAVIALYGVGIGPVVQLSWPNQPGAMDFGEVLAGQPAPPQKIRIANGGDDDLGNIIITSLAPVFTVGAYRGTLPPRDQQEVEIIFTPAGSGVITGSLRIDSDDPAQPSLFIQVSGSGKPVKICSVCGAPNHADIPFCAACGKFLHIRRKK